MTTQEPKLNNNDSAFPEVLHNIIEDYAHRDHHPISTKNYLPTRMTTQEPKLNNDDSAFPEVLPDAIKDYAHRDHHPISTITIPWSESLDQGYVDASLTSSSTFSDQGYDVEECHTGSTKFLNLSYRRIVYLTSRPPHSTGARPSYNDY
jgi:hypothetical protein